MKYRFELVEITANAKNKLPRDERNDLTNYFKTVRIEADTPRQACKDLAEQANGHLARGKARDETAVIKLPDYGNCQVVLKAVEVYPLFDGADGEDFFS